jgi:hypothetical protein
MGCFTHVSRAPIARPPPLPRAPTAARPKARKLCCCKAAKGGIMMGSRDLRPSDHTRCGASKLGGRLLRLGMQMRETARES